MTLAGLVVVLLVVVVAAAPAGADVRNPIKVVDVPGTNPTVGSPSGPGADPWIVRHADAWYLTYTVGGHLEVRRSETIGGLTDAEPRVVWPRRGMPEPDNRDSDFWAPELHRLPGEDGRPRWYLYYAAAPGSGATSDADGRPTALLDHRMHVLESEGDDPAGPYRYRGQIYPFYGIDMTVHRRPDGRLFAFWSGHCVDGPAPAFGCQALYAAEMANPWTLKSAAVQIAAPTRAWETVGIPINEAPEVLVRDGRLHLIFSASFFATDDYKLGRLTVPEDAELADAATWRGAKAPEPVFTRNDEEGVYGPGHNGFFRSPDGTEDWLIYHATSRPGVNAASFGGARTIRIQRFGWNEDGTPDFGRPVGLDDDLPAPSGDPTAQTQAEEVARVSGGSLTRYDDFAAVGGRAVRLEPARAGAAITVGVDAPRPGLHRVALRARVGPSAPVVHVRVGDEPVGRFDLRRPTDGYDEVDLGTHVLGPRDVPVRVEVADRTAPVALDQIGLGLGPDVPPRVAPARRAAARLRITVRPRRAPRVPIRVRTSGRLIAPAGLDRSRACRGRVSVQVKAGRRTISTRRARVRADCRFASRVTFRDPRRLAGVRRLRVIVRFSGNDVLRPVRAARRAVRIR